MIVYLDTSALVPLLVREPTSAACADLWDGSDRMATVRLTYVEAVAALAMAERSTRIDREQLDAARAVLDELWEAVDIVELGPELMRAAADLAVTHQLRSYDATHCAAAIALSDDELVAASGDRQLLRAWHAEGLAVSDTNA